MATLLLSEFSSNTETLCRDAGIPDGLLVDRRGRPPGRIDRCVPYLLRDASGIGDIDLCSLLEPRGPLLTRMCLDFGGPTVLALVEATKAIRSEALRFDAAPLSDELTRVSVGAGIFQKRTEKFTQAVAQLQRNMVDYQRISRRTGSDAASRRGALAALNQSSRDLNQAFAVELEHARRRLTPRYRSLVSGDRRAADMARHTRKVARLDFSSRIQAMHLFEFGRHARYIGPGAMAIDIGLRAKEVRKVREQGGNWQREAFAETFGFVASSAAGSAVGAVGLIAVGSVGWGTRSPALIIATGAAAAELGVAAVHDADAAGKAVGRGAYDLIDELLARSP